MRAADIRRLTPLFARITELQRYLVTSSAAAAERGDCDCTPNGDGVHRPAGQCRSALTEKRGWPADYCRSVVHVVVRTGLHQLHLPATHLSDEQVDAAIAGLASLVDRAPQVTEEEFVVQMQKLLRAVPDQPATEETPAQ